MAVDGILLAAIKQELQEKISGARIDKIYQPENNLLTIRLRQPGKALTLLASINPQRPRVHISKLSFDNPQYPPDFCMLLRKYLEHGIIEEISQPDFERILHITINNNNTQYKLVMEIMGRYSNIILIDKQVNVLDAMKRITDQKSSHRQLYPGIKYSPPPEQDKLNPLQVSREDFFAKIPEDFKKYCFRAILYNIRGIGPYSAKEIFHRAGIDYEQPYSELNKQQRNELWESFSKIKDMINQANFQPTVGLNQKGRIKYTSAFPLTHLADELRAKNFEDTGSLFDYYYHREVIQKKYRELQQKLLKTVNKYLQKNKKQQKKQYQRFQDSKNAEKFRQYGELIKGNIHQLKKGLETAELINYFDSENSKIEIKLNPQLDPAENARKYFKKYRKAKKSRKFIKRELGKLKHEEKYLNQVKLNIEQAENQTDLEEIEAELKEEGYIEKNKQINIQKRKSQQPQPPHKFESSDGYQILVGRNNKQNDYLTKKMANSQDLWLHTKKIAGSHVIIRNHTGKKIPETTLEEAAILAAYHSNARMSQNVPIDYTQVKNVNKPKGAKPGLVYYDDYQTIYVNPHEDTVRRLKKKNE